MALATAPQSQTRSWQETLRQQVLQPALDATPLGGYSEQDEKHLLEVFTWAFHILKKNPQELPTYIKDPKATKDLITLALHTTIRKVAEERIKWLQFEHASESIEEIRQIFQTHIQKQAPSVEEEISVEVSQIEDDFQVVDVKPSPAGEAPSLSNKRKLLQLWIKEPSRVLPPNFLSEV